ncbi:O-glycosyl hydrolase [Neolewinella xylanilytica]|uniref:O-glycosyl hydrolase n=1 Tax=Neolewinella xylanilytica TaxID=1514080 RepID=A0A2S6I6H4_9BACT|nr:glycoside hydrolase family 30 protein [Neolewinella xylanilytica]PPK87094.1 O-glycosyl hydrolase [Neolewinella xylanilytica]
MKRRFLSLLLCGAIATGCRQPPSLPESDQGEVAYTLDPTVRYQTVHNFGASDAWTIQYVGANWPEEQRNEIADLLFSKETDEEGNPVGIGLTAWRFNIGAGSQAQGDGSGITSEWRRAESFGNPDGTYDWSRHAGQRWMLQAAKDRGVETFIGFVNSPPVWMTRNGKAWSEDGKESNLQPEHYADFADYLVKIVRGVERETGIPFDFLSPFNEPQWEWMCCKQEGTPYDNDELAAVTREIDAAFTKAGITETELEIAETAQVEYLYKPDKGPKQRSDQLRAFFDPTSELYLGNLEHLALEVAVHDYFSTWPVENLVRTRQEAWTALQAINPELEYMASEYCLLEDNEEVKGPGRDLGMDPALYLARVMQADFLFANASSWQWWLGVSNGDYKDGLVYTDDDKFAGEVYDSKLLWTVGNFSYFLRPGAIRLSIERADGTPAEEAFPTGVIASAYENADGSRVIVFVNQQPTPQPVTLTGNRDTASTFRAYVTSDAEADDLRYAGTFTTVDAYTLPARSVVTWLLPAS